jgi:hypothetical protein
MQTIAADENCIARVAKRRRTGTIKVGPSLVLIGGGIQNENFNCVTGHRVFGRRWRRPRPHHLDKVEHRDFRRSVWERLAGASSGAGMAGWHVSSDRRRAGAGKDERKLSQCTENVRQGRVSAKKSHRVQEAKNLGYNYPGSPSVAPTE